MKIYYVIKHSDENEEWYSLSVDRELLDYVQGALEEIIEFGFDIKSSEGLADIDEAIDILEAVKSIKRAKGEE